MRWVCPWPACTPALTCYHLHRDEIEADIRANSEEAVMGDRSNRNGG